MPLCNVSQAVERYGKRHGKLVYDLFAPYLRKRYIANVHQ